MGRNLMLLYRFVLQIYFTALSLEYSLLLLRQNSMHLKGLTAEGVWVNLSKDKKCLMMRLVR
jgi:hypothetical protein